jgi:hypothetical protein
MKQETREEIRDGLRNYYGAIKRVVEATEEIRDGGYTSRHVHRVLAGEWKNDRILAVAARVLVSLREEEAATERRIESYLQRAKATA